MSKTIASQLKSACLKKIKIPGDGNCQFHAIAYMIRHNNIPTRNHTVNHKELRKLAHTLLKKNKSHYKNFIWDETFDDYLNNLKHGEYGDNLTLPVLADYFNLRVIILRDNRRRNIINSDGRYTITLLYTGDDGNDAHYDATAHNAS